MAKKKIIKQEKNKAQITSQVFMFILAAIVFGLIILYGYQAITKFMKTSSEIALADFQNEFIRETELIKRDYGSVSKIELTLPRKYTGICIADSDSTKIDVSDFEIKQPRMYSAWRKGAENVFITPPAQPIKIKDISIDGGYFCIENNFGKIALRIEGQGDKAIVSKWAI